MARLSKQREAEIRAYVAERRRNGWVPLDRTYVRDVTVLLHEIKHLRRELVNTTGEYHQLITLQGDLLRGVANGLRGDPPENVWWDHSDLPKRAAAMRTELAQYQELTARQDMAALLHAELDKTIDEGWAPVECPEDMKVPECICIWRASPYYLGGLAQRQHRYDCPVHA